ncbi:MAG: sulfite exporter TauE/SafE family protein [bacterium]
MENQIFFIMPLAFICELLDSSLGMGYGTTLTPLLLLFGYEPLQIVPAVLFSEFVSGITAGFFHHSLRNVNFSSKSQDTKVALVLSSFAVVGTIMAVFLAINLSPQILKIIIGVIVVSMGIVIFVTFNRAPHFSWMKISIIGVIASFNKGMSGGGYGPLVMGGQILSGIRVKNAIGITSISEGITCLVGITFYFFLNPGIDWVLAPWLMAGAILSVPLSAHVVKRSTEKIIKFAVATLVLILGGLTVLKVICKL